MRRRWIHGLAAAALGGAALWLSGAAPLNEQNPTPPRQFGEAINRSIAELTALHDSGSPRYDAACTRSGCHEGILDRRTLDAKVPEAHRLVARMGLPATHCALCHVSVEIVNGRVNGRGNAGTLGKNVDAVLKCMPCHTKHGPGKRLYGPPRRG